LISFVFLVSSLFWWRKKLI